jgi:hypothetical protein
MEKWFWYTKNYMVCQTARSNSKVLSLSTETSIVVLDTQI